MERGKYVSKFWWEHSEGSFRRLVVSACIWSCGGGLTWRELFVLIREGSYLGTNELNNIVVSFILYIRVRYNVNKHFLLKHSCFFVTLYRYWSWLAMLPKI
jgi:hypothetical protein